MLNEDQIYDKYSPHVLYFGMSPLVASSVAPDFLLDCHRNELAVIFVDPFEVRSKGNFPLDETLDLSDFQTTTHWPTFRDICYARVSEFISSFKRHPHLYFEFIVLSRYEWAERGKVDLIA